MILPAGTEYSSSRNRAPAGAEHWGIHVSKSLPEFRYMTFDVVGTLIDFEGGIKACLAEIAAEAGSTVDGEQALGLYRAARYSEDAGLFPDDLVRVYLRSRRSSACRRIENMANGCGIPPRAGRVSQTAPQRWPNLRRITASLR
jgi:hypothetical protein